MRTEAAGVEIAQPPAAIPTQLGKYRILHRLASGGMAHVYLAALDGPDGFQKLCVVKRLLSEFTNLEVFNRMFVHEAKVAALLGHPNIVHVFDFGKEDDQYFLAMEWIQGAALDRVQRLAARANLTLGPAVAVDIGISMASALGYAHAKRLPDGTPLNLVHRDVTPGNILISRDGAVKLADFGVVKTSVHTEGDNMVRGKYPYMSPEQLQGRALDGRSDLFSLGIVLYEVATGRRLFKRDTPEASMIAICRDPVLPPSLAVPGFPKELERILLKLLRKDPAARYQTGGELQAELSAYRAQSSSCTLEQELVAVMSALFPSSEALPTPAVAGASPTPPLPPDAALEELEAEPAVESAAAPSKQGWALVALVAAAALGTTLYWHLHG